MTWLTKAGNVDKRLKFTTRLPESSIFIPMIVLLRMIERTLAKKQSRLITQNGGTAYCCTATLHKYFVIAPRIIMLCNNLLFYRVIVLSLFAFAKLIINVGIVAAAILLVI